MQRRPLKTAFLTAALVAAVTAVSLGILGMVTGDWQWLQSRREEVSLPYLIGTLLIQGVLLSAALYALFRRTSLWPPGNGERDVDPPAQDQAVGQHDQRVAPPLTKPHADPAGRSDHIRSRIAATVLGKTVPVVLISILLAPFSVWTAGQGHESRLVPAFVLVTALLLVWWLVRTGRVAVAANVFVASLCVTILAGMSLNGGVRAPIFGGIVPLLAIVGWLYGVRSATLFTVGSVMTGGVFLLLDYQGWLRELPPPPPSMIWIDTCVFAAIAIGATTIPNRMLHRALADSEAKRSKLEATTRELTEREIALRESQEGLRREKTLTEAVFDNLPGIIHIYDDEYRLVRWNVRAAELSGFSDEELMYRPAGAGRPEAERAKIVDVIGRVLRDGRASAETTLITKHGNDIPIFVTAARLWLGGRPHVLGIGVDISERKQAEEHLRGALQQAEAASRAKDQFLAAASHELRTPLMPVLLIASSLEHDLDLPPDARQDLAVIREHIEVEKRLIGDLLDFTAIHAGKFHMNSVPTDVHEVVRAAIRTCEKDIERKGQRLETSFDAQHYHTSGDPDRLRQVFWNLLQNAMKFTPSQGAIMVRTGDDGDDFGGATLRVEVTDTGMGMDAETRRRLFRPFEQGPRDRRMQHYGGLGLGLAISKALVEAHGGSISAASDGPGHGATFVVRLPVSSHTPLPPDPPKRHADRVTGLKLLLVEDHPLTLKTLARLLKAEGHEVTTATTIAEALDFAEGGRFDLLLSDIGLPDGSGLDLMPTLRERYGLPGIALSGFGADSDLEASRKAGFLSHLTKPVTIEALRDTLREFAGQGAGDSN